MAESDSDRLSKDLAALRIDREARPEGGGARRVFGVLAVLGAIGAIGWFVVYPRLWAAVFKTEVKVTQIVKVSASQAQTTLTTTGYVVPQRTAKVGTKVLGRLAEVTVRENQAVEAGQVIARLDDVDTRSAIAAARARVQAARARAQTARANLEEVRQQVARERAAVDKGVTPRGVLQDLEARLKALEEQARAVDAEARAAQAEVDTLEVSYGHLTIVAPLSGRVVGKPASVGDTVTPGGPPIAEIVDTTSLLVETDVPEGRLEDVRLGAACEIVLDAYPRKKHPGEVTEISARINRAKSTVVVKVRFTGDMDGVLPDMAARVNFLFGKPDEVNLQAADKIVVPKEAVVERDGMKVVFVVGDGGVVKKTAVTLGPPFASGFELVQGPAPGTTIVANPPATLEDGHKIKEKTD